MIRLFGGAALAALLTAPALAEDAALVIGIDRYEQLARVRGAADLTGAESALTALGFTTAAVPNARSAAAAGALAEFASAAPEAERLIVALTGRFVTDGARTWMLTADATAPRLTSVGQQGISVETLLTVLGSRPGHAVLLIGAEPGDAAHDPWLRDGLGPIEAPQGVTVITGLPADITGFFTGAALTPEADLIAEARAARRLVLEGFVPPDLHFMPARPDAPPPVLPDPTAAQLAAELALWEGATALDTADAYRNYLARYPRGAHAAEAQVRLSAILAEPYRPARLAEEALNLTRDQRRAVQRNLTLLGFSTRGVDGIFGSGSRGAILAWQQQNGYPQTSYLSAEEITRLDAQAARRQAEQQAEEARQAAERARLDNAYWEETGARGDEPGYRAYLERYPQGIHAPQARAGLGDIEAARNAAREAVERSAWERARQAGNLAGYQSYLAQYPEGRFRAEAEAQIARLSPVPVPAAPDTAALAAAETRLGLNEITLRIIEQRLERLGLEPGEVDGVFTTDTRRAIRRYQELRGLTAVSGYLNEETVVRLLADAISGN